MSGSFRASSDHMQGGAEQPEDTGRSGMHQPNRNSLSGFFIVFYFFALIFSHTTQCMQLSTAVSAAFGVSISHRISTHIQQSKLSKCTYTTGRRNPAYMCAISYAAYAHSIHTTPVLTVVLILHILHPSGHMMFYLLYDLKYAGGMLAILATHLLFKFFFS